MSDDLLRKIGELRDKVQRLEDIKEIETLKYRYFRSLDTADHKELRSVLHDDFRTDIIGGDYTIKIEGAEKFVEFIRNVMHSGIVAIHQGHHPEISFTNAEEATAKWYLYDDFWDLGNKTRMYGSAIYDDHYVRENGRWLIKFTSYVRVVEAVDEVSDPPRFTAHMLGEKGIRHTGDDAPRLEGDF